MHVHERPVAHDPAVGARWPSSCSTRLPQTGIDHTPGDLTHWPRLSLTPCDFAHHSSTDSMAGVRYPSMAVPISALNAMRRMGISNPTSATKPAPSAIEML